MEFWLRKQLVEECNKLIERHHKYHNWVHAEWTRNANRIKNAPKKEIKTPEYWSRHRLFNPFYVRSNAQAIAKSIARKIEDGTYKPATPFEKPIPKHGGGERKLTIYQIPDAAVSLFFYTRLLAKNRHRFSSFSYAYRNDRNVHFAIQDIAVDLEEQARTFVAEFDFSDFFGSIDHNYLFTQLDANGFFVSGEDKSVIKAFLSSSEKGIPQGTSISLFLANLVCWRLDKSLEKAGLKFARYADDTVIWSENYAAICHGFSIINDFSRSAGVEINLKKSLGISLLVEEGAPTEINSKESFDFLGYSLGVGKIAIRDKAEVRIKKQISYLLYRNLLQPLKEHPLRSLQIPANNRDKALLIAMMQIRRYLYGGLLERDLFDYIKGRKKILQFHGLMSFYPLVNDEDQLKRLDGWLVSVIHRSLQARNKLLLTHGYSRGHTFPFNVSHDQLVAEFRRVRIGAKRERLLKVPSFYLIYKVIQKGLLESGIERVMHPASSRYVYLVT